MTDRQYEINTFLRYMASVVQQNPDQKFDENTVYGFLKMYDINSKDDYSVYFDEWIEKYKGNSGLRVYKNNRQKSFLQFTNYNSDNSEFIKLYLSLDSSVINDGVNKIFDYISDNKIVTASKVADKSRSDAIVLRIKKIDDALKVIHFINSDSFFLQNAKHTNPFLKRCGVVGMAYDGDLSYNAMVSFLVSNYINEMNENDLLEEVSCDDFANYLKNVIQDTFVSGEKLGQFVNSSYAVDNFMRIDKSYSYSHPNMNLVVNFMHVMNLVSDSVSKEDDISKYLNSYQDSIDESKNATYYNYLYGVYHKNDYEYDGDTEEIPVVDEIQVARDLLVEFIKYGLSDKSKYADLNMLKRSVIEFCNGKEKTITRDYGFRDKFKKCLNKELLNKATNENIDEFFRSVMVESNVFDKYDVFIGACMQTYYKYGREQLRNAINEAVKGNYKKFTNENGNYRTKMSNFTVQDINDCITKFMDNYTVFFVVDIGSQVVGKLEDMIQEQNKKVI